MTTIATGKKSIIAYAVSHGMTSSPDFGNARTFLRSIGLAVALIDGVQTLTDDAAAAVSESERLASLRSAEKSANARSSAEASRYFAARGTSAAVAEYKESAARA